MDKKDLSKDDVLHLAKLSALKLAEDEIENIKTKLKETIDYIKNLNELDTGKVSLTNSVIKIKNVGFEDGAVCERLFTTELALKNSKNRKNKFFAVKRIL